MDSFLKTKRALVFPKGAATTNRSFSYSVAFGVLDEKYFPKKSGWVTNKLTKKIIDDYTFDFFVADDYFENGDFGSFENKFNISVTILCYNPKTNKICIGMLAWFGKNKKKKQVVVLKLPDGTYAYVKNLSRLLSSQISTTKGARHVCTYCFNDFALGSEKIKTHTCENTIPKHLEKEEFRIRIGCKKIVEEVIMVGGEPTSRTQLYYLEYDEIIGEGGWNDEIIGEGGWNEGFEFKPITSVKPITFVKPQTFVPKKESVLDFIIRLKTKKPAIYK